MLALQTKPVLVRLTSNSHLVNVRGATTPSQKKRKHLLPPPRRQCANPSSTHRLAPRSPFTHGVKRGKRMVSTQPSGWCAVPQAQHSVHPKLWPNLLVTIQLQRRPNPSVQDTHAGSRPSEVLSHVSRLGISTQCQIGMVSLVQSCKKRHPLASPCGGAQLKLSIVW